MTSVGPYRRSPCARTAPLRISLTSVSNDFFNHTQAVPVRPPASEQKADFRNAFYEQVAKSGNRAGANAIPPRAVVGRCIFQDGMHWPGQDCPHGNTHDETGEVPTPGWTAQQR